MPGTAVNCRQSNQRGDAGHSKDGSGKMSKAANRIFKFEHDITRKM